MNEVEFLLLLLLLLLFKFMCWARRKSTHQVPKNVPPLLHVYMLFCCCFSSSISLFAPFSLLLIFSYSHMFAHCCRAANKMSIRWIPWIPWLLSLIHVKLELKIAWNRTYLTWTTTNSQNTQATNRDALKAQSHLPNTFNKNHNNNNNNNGNNIRIAKQNRTVMSNNINRKYIDPLAPIRYISKPSYKQT